MTADAPAIEPLPWDSEHFRLSVGRVRPDDNADLASVARAADAAGFDCVYLLLPTSDTAALARAQDAGFRVVVIRAELERPVGAHEDAEGITEARAEDEPWLAEIAATAFLDTRFAADPRFDRDRVASLYRRWVERGLRSEDRRVLVAPPDRGFVIVRIDRAGGMGNIELIAVRPDAAGAGVGRELMREAHALFSASGLRRATVTTQGGNVAAMRLYEGCGYRTTAMAYWLHRWRGWGTTDASV